MIDCPAQLLPAIHIRGGQTPIMFSTSASYAPHYFSLDDLLATHERVPLTAVGDVRGLGFLDPSSCATGTAFSSSGVDNHKKYVQRVHVLLKRAKDLSTHT